MYLYFPRKKKRTRDISSVESGRKKPRRVERGLKINRTGENRDFQRGYPAENRNKRWRDWNTCRRGTRGKPVSPNTWFSSVYSVTGREILDRPPRSHPRSFFERLIFRTRPLPSPLFGRRTSVRRIYICIYRNIAGRVRWDRSRSMADLFLKI